MTKRVQQLLIAGLAIVAIVLLVLMPKQPATKRAEVGEVVLDSLDLQIEKAVAIIQGGGNPMEGIMMLRDVLEKDSTNVNAHLYLGMFSIQSGQLDKAVNRFETVIRIDPENDEAHWQLATLLFEQKKFEEAIVHFERLIEIEPEFYTAHFFIGKCYEEMGEVDQALEKYEEYLPLAEDTVVIQKVNEIIIELKNL